MREYIVSLKKDVDYDSFWNEIESVSDGDGFVPARRVEIVNNRDGSLRSCHYSLTDEEATSLRNDERVFSVEIPPQQRTDIEIGLKTVTQTGNFNKTTSDAGSNINWGLIRHSNNTNVYGTSTTTTLSYLYDFDGTGVDVVIQDSGLQIDHPEFQNSSGVSRVQPINWYTSSGLSGSQSAFHYRDYSGHGTHVAGITAGKRYGWAKNARIYSVKINGLEGAGDSGGISVTDCFDVIKLWHRNKPVDPSTGFKRPTIVNMSWGYGNNFANINGGSYRGNAWTGSARDTSKGMTGVFTGSAYRHPVRVGSIDSDVQELIDEGVIVCIAAGNEYSKADRVGGLDYDNYYNNTSSGQVYYNRGMSPYSDNAIIVGSLDSNVYSASLDQKSVFSNSGPGVDIFAAGSNVMSACSAINDIGGVSHYWNNAFNQANISGTSMASPQICGLGALYLQANANATPSQVKTALQTLAKDQVYRTGLNNDYTNQRSVWGATANVTYFAASANVSSPVTPPSGNTSSIILQGQYVKIGFSGLDGTLGYGGSVKPGIQYDATGTGTFPGTTDYLTPGTPFEGWAVKYNNAMQGYNNNAFYNTPGVTGSFVNYSGVSFRGELFDNRVLWTGEVSGQYTIEHDVRFNDDFEKIDFQTTIRNNSGSAFTNLRYARFIDPDAGADIGGSYSTRNYRGYPALGISARNVVIAETTVGPAFTLGLFSPMATDVNTSVTYPWGTDPDTYYAGTDSGSGDNSIGIAFNKSTLSSGESVTFRYSYFTTPNALNLRDLFEIPVFNVFKGIGGRSTASFKKV
jgi:hypothetical protein